MSCANLAASPLWSITGSCATVRCYFDATPVWYNYGCAETTVLLCKFHCMQAWNRRLSQHEKKAEIMSMWVSLHYCQLPLLWTVVVVVDYGNCTILLALDISAAFDSIDHSILCNRVSDYFGINGSVLSWLSSFVTHSTSPSAPSVPLA